VRCTEGGDQFAALCAGVSCNSAFWRSHRLPHQRR
jgi:hypothetical protein